MVTAAALDLTDVARRLEAAVIEAGGKKHVSQVSGVPSTSLDRYMKAQSEAPSLTLGRLAAACNVSVDFLLSGVLLKGHTPTATSVLDGHQLQMSNAHFPDLRQADPGADVPEGFVAVPFLEVRASAGSGRASLPAETVAASHFLFSQSWLRSLGVSPQHAELLQAEGDSMYPTIQDRDLMLLDRGHGEVLHGFIYALVVNGLVIVKRVHHLAGGGMILLSDNDRYPSETIRREEVGDLNFQGRVKWYGRAI